MKKLGLLLVLILSYNSTYAQKSQGISYDCSQIVEACVKPGDVACYIGSYENSYIEKIELECNNLGDGELTLDNMFEARFISWLLVLKLNEAVELKVTSIEQEAQVRTILDLVVQAIAPIEDHESTQRRFNSFVTDREMLRRNFSRVLAAHPNIGSDYIKYLYDIAKFDHNQNIRNNALSDIGFLDANEENVAALIAYAKMNNQIQAFNGFKDGTFRYEPVSNSVSQYSVCLSPRCKSTLEQEFKNGRMLESKELIEF